MNAKSHAKLKTKPKVIGQQRNQAGLSDRAALVQYIASTAKLKRIIDDIDAG